MQLTDLQAVVIILVTALATIITRFVPFVLFPEGKEYPKIITYLSKVLPPAMMGLLVVVNFATQLLIDLVFSFFTKYFNIESTVRLTPLVSAIGMI